MINSNHQDQRVIIKDRDVKKFMTPEDRKRFDDQIFNENIYKNEIGIRVKSPDEVYTKNYQGESYVDFVNLNGSKKYELKVVTQNEHKSYQNSAKDIIKNIQNKAEKMKVGETLPDYLIDLEGLPDSLKWNIAQNIQDQLQSITNLNELNFVY